MCAATLTKCSFEKKHKTILLLQDRGISSIMIDLFCRIWLLALVNQLATVSLI